MLKYPHIAWDFDGTLYDSYPFVIRCYLRTLKDYGVTADPVEVSALIHKTLRHAHDRYAPECGVPLDELRTRYKGYEYANEGPSAEVLPVPGIPELLRDIVAAGGKNHICSNRSTVECRAYLERDGLAQYFDLYAGGEMGLKLKPTGEMYRYLQQTSGARPEQMLMVGDRPLDYLEAHAAGSPGCFFEPEGLAEFPDDAEFCCHTVEDLRNFLFGNA